MENKRVDLALLQSIEDFILLVGTSVAFIAFILWCCFPIEPKDSLGGSEHLTTQVTDTLTLTLTLEITKITITTTTTTTTLYFCRQFFKQALF